MSIIIHPVTGKKMNVPGPIPGVSSKIPHQPDRKYVDKQTKEKNTRKWIKEAITQPGSLRKTLGIKKGQKIPPKKLEVAAEKPGITGKRARLAKNLSKFNKK